MPTADRFTESYIVVGKEGRPFTSLYTYLAAEGAGVSGVLGDFHLQNSIQLLLLRQENL